jgi:hypothetical protein
MPWVGVAFGGRTICGAEPVTGSPEEVAETFRGFAREGIDHHGVPRNARIEEGTMTDHQLDEARAEAFAGKMVDVLNGAGIALMASVGHQVGLFDAMAGLPSSTSATSASGSGRW